MKLNSVVAEDLARKFRIDNGLSVAEAINLKALLRKCNVLTLFRPMSDYACGISVISQDNNRFMLVNSNNPIGRQNFTIAHELYHLYYDKHPLPHMCLTDGKTNEEHNANMFASALLMPKDGIYSMLSAEALASRDITLGQVFNLEQYFEVSHQSMLYRLRALRLLNDAQVNEFLHIPVMDKAAEYGCDLSLYKPGNESLIIGDYGEKAHLLFEKEIISEGHFNELINLIRNE